MVHDTDFPACDCGATWIHSSDCAYATAVNQPGTGCAIRIMPLDTRAGAQYITAMETGIVVNGPDPVAVEKAIDHLLLVMQAIAEHNLDRETGIEALQLVGKIVSTSISDCRVGDVNYRDD